MANNKQQSNKIGSVKLSNYDNLTPYQFGEYTSTGGRWVNYGKDNDYPEYLRYLYMNSGTHSAIINGTQNLATGEGVEIVQPELNPLSNKWLNENFPIQTVKKLIGDLKLYAYAIVQVFEGKVIKYSEATKYRFGEKNEQGIIDSMWFSNDWENYMRKDNRPVKLPMYNGNNEDPISIAVVQLDKKGFDYYAAPDYSGCINWVEIESELSKLHLSNIHNGLMPSFVINFVGTEFSDEQMNDIENKINKKFSGSLNAGRAIIGFSDSKDNATTIQTIDQPNISDSFTFLSTESTNKILVGHNVTSSLLFGINRETGNGLGSNAEELSQAYYLFYENTLKSYQNYILELITKIMEGNLLYATVKFKTYNPFNMTEKTQTLSKYSPINEIQSQEMLSKIDENAIKTGDILINERLFSGKLNENALYQFVKSSNNNNIINKKFEILSKKEYLFKPNEELIKNCADYYWIEKTFLKKLK